MTTDLSHYRFVAKALLNKGAHPRELARTMPAHPLSYMELPFDPEYTLYNSRLTPEKLDTATDDEMYWAVRTNVIFRHTGELPIEIVGPDAERLLNRVFARDVSKVRVGRCSYQFACYHDGGLVNDGVMLRLAEDRFWMAQSDGDLLNWYRAHAVNDDGSPMDVRIFDPGVWVSQVQGPRSLEVLERHREQETCASCHRKIDPLGFAFENFDVVGRWRDKYKLAKDPIDPSATMANGKRIADIVDFKKMLKVKLVMNQPR